MSIGSFPHLRRTAAGFTLVELLIALTVFAILSAIAWPGYAGIMHRAQRNDAGKQDA